MPSRSGTNIATSSMKGALTKKHLYFEPANIITSEELTLALSSMKILEQSRNLTCFLPSAYCSSLSLIASMAEENLQNSKLSSDDNLSLRLCIYDLFYLALGMLTTQQRTMPH